MAQRLTPPIPASLASHQGSIEGLCRKYHVARLALFGSASRGEACEGSDLDLLVSFEPGQTPGLGFFMLQQELQDVLGLPVDLNTQEDLSRHFRDQVLREARVVYEV
ncbi:MAG: nucleotidyltransferase family protein [Geothrix sp.]|nr:nucleotidyltransferase family protein [Geothrix sp.]